MLSSAVQIFKYLDIKTFPEPYQFVTSEVDNISESWRTLRTQKQIRNQKRRVTESSWVWQPSFYIPYLETFMYSVYPSTNKWRIALGVLIRKRKHHIAVWSCSVQCAWCMWESLCDKRFSERWRLEPLFIILFATLLVLMIVSASIYGDKRENCGKEWKRSLFSFVFCLDRALF